MLLTVTALGSPAPAPAPKAEPYTGMEVYMGTLMAATLLAKGDNPSLSVMRVMPNVYYQTMLSFVPVSPTISCLILPIEMKTIIIAIAL